uniref:Uncharacterized protein n=1 Tax=Anguilla anguilla TaxID=7936 RepID=A0A0E9W896_ANGAN
MCSILPTTELIGGVLITVNYFHLVSFYITPL